MTPIEAFGLTFSKVKELEESGIKLTVKPSKSRTNPETVKKYNQPDRIPPVYWINVSFTIENNAQAMKIHETANYLGMCGIRFDTGGWSKGRDWELDWSFKYTGKEDEDWRDAREDVEDMILHIDDENFEQPPDELEV